jgi:hypothetical protein
MWWSNGFSEIFGHLGELMKKVRCCGADVGPRIGETQFEWEDGSEVL